MDINFTPEELAFRDEVRVFLDTKLPKEIASKVKTVSYTHLTLPTILLV